MKYYQWYGTDSGRKMGIASGNGDENGNKTCRNPGEISEWE